MEKYGLRVSRSAEMQAQDINCRTASNWIDFELHLKLDLSIALSAAKYKLSDASPMNSKIESFNDWDAI